MSGMLKREQRATLPVYTWKPGWRDYVPISVGLGWSIVTILAFAFGPFIFEVKRPLLLYGYLFAANLALGLGYVTGIRRGQPVHWRRPVVRAVAVCVWVGVVKIIVDYILGVSPLSLDAAFENATLAKEMHRERTADYLGLLLGPFTYSAMPLGIFYWTQLKWRVRLAVGAICLCSVFQAFGSATRSGILFMLLSIGTPLLVRRVHLPFFVGGIRSIAVALAILVGFFAYGSFIAETRDVVGPFESRMLEARDFGFNPDNMLYRDVPRAAQPGLMTFLYYYTHGYANLDLALNMPFIGSALGAGHSRFLMRNVARLFGEEYLRYCYFFRLNSEGGMLLSKWATAYVWIASDVTFTGSVVVMFLFGMIMARAWRDARYGGNPFAVVLFTFCIMQVVALPQVTITQDGQSGLACYVILIAWFISRRQVAWAANR